MNPDETTLEWNVYRENINTRKIIPFNIFSHHFFTLGCAKAVRECVDKNDFTDKIKSELMYYYWSKCEWEILLASWTRPEDTKTQVKIDVYLQVMLNFNHFIDYLWDNRAKLKKIKE